MISYPFKSDGDIKHLGEARHGEARRGKAGLGEARAGVQPPHSFYKSLQLRLVWLEHQEPMSMARK